MKKVFISIWISTVFFTSGFASGIDKKGPEIRLAYLQNDIHQLACWVALEKKLFRKEGLNVSVSGIFKAGPEEMAGFAAGALDFGYVGEAPSTTAVANSVAEVSVLAQVNTEGSSLIVHTKSIINKIQQMVNKRVAIPGHSTVQDFLLRKAFKKFGVEPTQVGIMVLKPPEMISALMKKQIDAFISWEPYPAKAQTMGIGRTLISSRDIWREHPCCVFVGDNKFVEKYTKETRKMVSAHVKATDFINENPEEAVKIAVKYTGMDEETIRIAMRNVNYTYMLSVEGETEYVTFLAKLKYIQPIDADIFVKKFINQGILEEIVKK